ncbi:MAG: IPT/TIG domain-containing protein [Methanomicrobiales archaeon]|nr:IPT/TIG domain-containing protein [Methanomicrobiales archaeon]
MKSAPAVPVVHHINPSTVKAGAKAFILTITGEHFAKGNRVQWKGVARETTFVSSTTIKAKVLATDIAKSGRYVVSVYRPGRDVATSNGVSVNVRK